MQKPASTSRYFFVDESGDTTFYDRHGNYIVGQEGCSPILMLGYVRTEDPHAVREGLANLKAVLAADALYNQIPSFRRKTVHSFHAKNDSPEVRSEVFKLLRQLPLKGQFIVARKREKTFRNTFGANESRFYDHLVTNLFKRSLHLAADPRFLF